MTKVRTILKSSKLADGKQQVLLLVSDRGKRSYFTTGFSATPNQFDGRKEVGRFTQGRGIPSYKVDRTEEDGSIKVYTNKEANDFLAEFEQRAKDLIKKYNENHVDWGFEQFRADFINAPKRNLFYAFAQEVNEKEYRSRGHYGKASITEGALESLKAFDQNIEKKSFHDISIAYLNDYIDFCRDKGHKNGTISIRLREIRRIFNIAIRDKVIAPNLYPFSSGKDDGKVRIPKTEYNKTDQYLPMESMKRIAQSHFDNPLLERTKHLFLFSYYCRGMNWRDMALLTSSNLYTVTVADENSGKSREVTMIQYRRAKTKGEFDIQITPPIEGELTWFRENTVLYGDYLLPIVSKAIAPDKMDDYLHQIRKRFNRSLKALAKELKLPESQLNISIYTARHSFAMTLKEKGRPVEFISQSLGHQSVETTKHYLAKFNTTEMAEGTFIDLSEGEAYEKPVAKEEEHKHVKRGRRPK